jgi:hypothetical protein
VTPIGTTKVCGDPVSLNVTVPGAAPPLEVDVLEDDVLVDDDVLEDVDVLDVDVLADDPPLHLQSKRWCPSGAHDCTPSDPPGQAQLTWAPGMQVALPPPEPVLDAVEVLPPPEPVPDAPLTTVPWAQPCALNHASTMPVTAAPNDFVSTRPRYQKMFAGSGTLTWTSYVVVVVNAVADADVLDRLHRR